MSDKHRYYRCVEGTHTIAAIVGEVFDRNDGLDDIILDHSPAKFEPISEEEYEKHQIMQALK